MSNLQYLSIQAYRVTQRLRGEPIYWKDPMAERLPCGGCGAPAGYFCLYDTQTPLVLTTRFTCKGIIGSQNPRTLLAFAKGAEEIRAQEAEAKK